MNILAILASLRAGESITFCGPGETGNYAVEVRDAALPDLVDRVAVARSIVVSRDRVAALDAREVVDYYRESMRDRAKQARHEQRLIAHAQLLDRMEMGEVPECPKE